MRPQRHPFHSATNNTAATTDTTVRPIAVATRSRSGVWLAGFPRTMSMMPLGSDNAMEEQNRISATLTDHGRTRASSKSATGVAGGEYGLWGTSMAPAYRAIIAP